MKILLNLIIMFSLSGNFAPEVAAQDTVKKPTLDNVNVVGVGVMDGDTIPFVTLMEVPVISTRMRTPEEEAAYKRMKRNVIKVYPYAQRATQIMNELEAITSGIDKRRHEKKYRKRLEKQLKEEFTDELKKLTVSQGKVLIKLIERDTGRDMYDLIKSQKSGITAFFYQGIGKRFGYDLKQGYKVEENKDLEEIVTYLEENGLDSMGKYNFKTPKSVTAFEGLPAVNTVLKSKKGKK